MDALTHLNPPKTRPLFAIGADLVRFRDSVNDGGEIAPELDAYFDGLAVEEGDKLDGYVMLIRHLEMESGAAKAEAEQYLARSRARISRVAELKARLKLHLETTGRKKIVTTTGRPISIRGNGGKLPLVIDDKATPDSVGDLYVLTTRTIDKDAVRDALESGTELAFARLTPRGTNLQIG